MAERASFDDLYENSPCGFLSVSPDGQIVRINATLVSWLGYSAAELLNTPLNSILSVGGRIALETHIKPLLRMQGSVQEISIDLLTKDNQRVPFIVNLAERRDDAGKCLSTRFALMRFNDRRNYEKDLLKARKLAEGEVERERENSLLREQFIAVLGHDLRNPLASILSGIRIIKRGTTLSERHEFVLEGMTKSVWRADKLINDVLDFARGKLGDGLVLQRIDNGNLKASLSQVIDEARMMAPEVEIRDDLKIGGSVNCDGARIGQALANLLSNSIAHGDPDAGITVLATEDNKQFTLSVENSGKAIPASTRENLFEPFFRGEVRDVAGGLGLGLFIVSEITKAHDGTIDVMSDENFTRFTLTIPLSE